MQGEISDTGISYRQWMDFAGGSPPLSLRQALALPFRGEEFLMAVR